MGIRGNSTLATLLVVKFDGKNNPRDNIFKYRFKPAPAYFRVLALYPICRKKAVIPTRGSIAVTNLLSFTPQVWRVGFMGHNSHPENVDMFLRLFKEALEVVKGRPKSQL